MNRHKFYKYLLITEISMINFVVIMPYSQLLGRCRNIQAREVPFFKTVGRERDDNLQRKRFHTVSFRSVTSFIVNLHYGKKIYYIKLLRKFCSCNIMSRSIRCSLMKFLENKNKIILSQVKFSFEIK